LIYSNTPKPLKGQQNKSKTKFSNRYIKINKSNLCYIYGPRGDRIISVNKDKNKKLVSKTNYKKTALEQIYIDSDNCKKIECYHFIHR